MGMGKMKPKKAPAKKAPPMKGAKPPKPAY